MIKVIIIIVVVVIVIMLSVLLLLLNKKPFQMRIFQKLPPRESPLPTGHTELSVLQCALGKGGKMDGGRLLLGG